MQTIAPEHATTARTGLLDFLGSGWTALRGPGSRCAVGRLEPLARRAGRIAVLHEVDLGEDVLPHRARLEVCDRAGREFGDDVLVVFTDPAHSFHVWAWRSRSSSLRDQYVEFRVPPRGPASHRAIEREIAGGSPSGGRRDSRGGPATVIRALAPAARRFGAPMRSGLPSLVASIETSEDPSLARQLWRSLRKDVFLDRRCGDGERLASVASHLETIYLACVDRMRSWVDDSAGAGPRRRPEYLSDFRAVVETAEDVRRFASPAVYVRRLIAQRNLHGLDPRPPLVRKCRERLLDYIDATGHGLPYLDLNIHSAAEPAGSDCPAMLESGAAALQEEFTLLRRTLEMLRESRLAHGWPTPELRSAMLHLEQRRRALSSQIRQRAAVVEVPFGLDDPRTVFLLDVNRVVHVLDESGDDEDDA